MDKELCMLCDNESRDGLLLSVECTTKGMWWLSNEDKQHTTEVCRYMSSRYSCVSNQNNSNN
jgi:hypothetical protein